MKRTHLLIIGLTIATLVACTPKSASNENGTIDVSFDCNGGGFLTAVDYKGNFLVGSENVSGYTINLLEPATYIVKANPNDGMMFAKWTKDDKDYSEDSEITITCDADAKYDAVFVPLINNSVLPTGGGN